MNKDYQPIPMRPLTMRGVFGITWAVTKRHFFASVMYTLIWVLIAAAVLALCAAPAVIGIVANNAGQEGGVAALVALSVILMFVAALAIWLMTANVVCRNSACSSRVGVRQRPNPPRRACSF